MAGSHPVSGHVRYRERCSQFPVLGAAVAAALLAGSVAGLTVIGGPNGRGAGAGGAILLAVALLALSYLVFAVLDLPNGIDIGGGQFTLGARGVRPVGRLWRRVSGPLDAVRSWEVLGAAHARLVHRQRPGRSPSGRTAQYLGDLRLLARGPALRLIVDPAAVTVRFPARLLIGYLPVRADAAGAVWDGVVLIGTRHPVALTAALERALPERRAMGGSG